MLLALAIASVSIVPANSTVAESSLAATSLRAGDDPLQAYPDLNLKVDLSVFEALAPAKSSKVSSCKGEWVGRIATSNVHVFFNVLDSNEFGFSEPEDVIWSWRSAMTDVQDQYSEAQSSDFAFESTRCVPGPFGAAPFLAATRAAVQSKAHAESKSTRFLLAGLLPDKGWSLRVDVTPPLEKAADSELATFLEKCVHYDGKPRDPKWSDAEAQSLWAHLAPESTQKTYGKPVRTEHYIILNDAPGAKDFAKKIEAHYATVKKVLPFEESKGRRLLPVLLFKTGEEFQHFYVQKFKLDPKTTVYETCDAAGPWFATSSEADDEEDQLQDLAKQLMVNRAHCWGATLWFRSGLRWYIASKPIERIETRNGIKKGHFTPLEKLLENTAWGERSRKQKLKGASDEPDYWDQSALWMEFLHDSPSLKDKFPKFVQAMGVIPDSDSQRVCQALESIYGTSPSALQAKWVEYFKK
jgi:hypothetical protein